MKKVPFTQVGIDQKRKELEALPESEFRTQLKSLQAKTREWIIENFELEPEQVKFVQSIPNEMAVQLGLSSAIAFDYKLPLILNEPAGQAARIRICKGVNATGSFHADWSEGSPPKVVSWNIGVQLGF